MKKKIVSILLVAALGLTLAGCRETAEFHQVSVPDAIIENVEDPEEPEVSVEPEELQGEELNDALAEYLSIIGYYKNYLVTGYDAESDNFTSPETGRLYYQPYFILADANGDNYNDVIIYGDLGLRGKLIGEVYYFNREDGGFYAAEIPGYVCGLAEACVIAVDVDREVAKPVYYDCKAVYSLVTGGAERLLAHNNVLTIDENENESEEDFYYEGENEITEEDFNAKYQKYLDAWIDIDFESYTKMSTESIDAAFPELD